MEDTGAERLGIYVPKVPRSALEAGMMPAVGDTAPDLGFTEGMRSEQAVMPAREEVGPTVVRDLHSCLLRATQRRAPLLSPQPVPEQGAEQGYLEDVAQPLLSKGAEGYQPISAAEEGGYEAAGLSEVGGPTGGSSVAKAAEEGGIEHGPRYAAAERAGIKGPAAEGYQPISAAEGGAGLSEAAGPTGGSSIARAAEEGGIEHGPRYAAAERAGIKGPAAIAVEAELEGYQPEGGYPAAQVAEPGLVPAVRPVEVAVPKGQVLTNIGPVVSAPGTAEVPGVAREEPRVPTPVRCLPLPV